MAQMETIVQLQQAEIAALQAENEAIKVKIGCLTVFLGNIYRLIDIPMLRTMPYIMITSFTPKRAHQGLDVQHVAMAQKRSRDPHAATRA